ncbi:hypothetical protein EVAR_77203_1 [Eumeta japonica]|uniref:Uncharacterized protein n=1 Tax=Eumeta variegata TaxID=151549 RepID=A0A4C1T2U2_EUMVA|nr:hypothetical protein EVAR_77203_1 [Eumeta japonica]
MHCAGHGRSGDIGALYPVAAASVGQRVYIRRTIPPTMQFTELLAVTNYYGNCRYREYVCRKCQRVDFLQQVCPERSGPTDSTDGDERREPRREAGRSGVYFGDVDREDNEEENELIEKNLNLISFNHYKAVKRSIKILVFIQAGSSMTELDWAESQHYDCERRNTKEKKQGSGSSETAHYVIRRQFRAANYRAFYCTRTRGRLVGQHMLRTGVILSVNRSN